MKDFTAPPEMSNLYQQFNELVLKIETEKLEMLKRRLSMLNIKIDLDVEAKKERFHLLHTDRFEIENDFVTKKVKEIVYYNDGSIDGLKVITFITTQIFDLLNGVIKIELEPIM